MSAHANDNPTIVVIGGVAGGAGAAVKARRTNERAEIIIFERGPFVSYANCGIPYYVGDDIRDRSELLLITSEQFKDRFNIDIRTDTEVVRIDRASKTVEARDRQTGEKTVQRYDKLIIATGSSPAPPPILGSAAENVFTLWTVPDADAIKAWINRSGAQRAAVVGAGFVGLEAVEALLNLGLHVTLVELAPQIMPSFDAEMVVPAQARLREAGVDVRLGVKVDHFIGSPVEKLVLPGGEEIEIGLAILAAGVRPNLLLAQEAGLDIGLTGGLAVDAHMRTSDPDIFAAGDIVESKDMVTGQPVRIPLAGPANKQARVAGFHAAQPSTGGIGPNLEFAGVLGSSIVKVLDYTLARTGLTEREAKAKGLPHFVSYTHSGDHADYYPGATQMAVKLVVEESSGRILGAQIAGRDGVDKRIDVLATAIYARLTAFDLEHLDLAYAPPFSSAKDPVNIAGMVAANILRGEVSATTAAQLKEALGNGEVLQVVDVRNRAEYAEGHVPGAVNIPINKLREKYEELDKSRKTILYCGVAYRSYLGLKMLADKGFEDLSHVSGGWRSLSTFFERAGSDPKE